MNLSIDDLNTPPWARKLLFITLAVSLLLTVWSLSSYLWDKYRVVRDVQNFYWMARAQDPTLFATDYLYISSDNVITADILGLHLLLYPLSPGYGMLFYLASSLVDYVWLTKLSILGLVLVSVIYLYKTGRFLVSNLTGATLSLIFIFFILASPLSISIASGLQRAFSLPLFIVFLYYLVCRKYVGSAIVIVISALVYLPNFPPMVLAYALSWIYIGKPYRLSINVSRSSLVPLAVSLACSALIVALALAVQLDLIPSSTPPAFATQTSQAVPVSNNPSYQSGGSMPLFIGFPFLGRVGIFDTGGDVANFLVLVVIAFLIYRVVGSRSLQRIPRAVWCLLAGGVIMYGVSLFFVFGLSSFALYLPSRYTRSTIFLSMVFFVGLNWVEFSGKLPAWLRRNTRLILFFVLTLTLACGIVYVVSPNRSLLIPTFWFLGLIASGILAVSGFGILIWFLTYRAPLGIFARWGLLITASLLVLVLGTVYIRVLGVKTTNPPEFERNIYEFVAKLPKDTVLAGNPDIMTNVPLFSKRSVLFRELFPRTDAPIVEYFDVQYAESTQPVLDFCRRYEIGYLVLDTRDYSPSYLAKEEFFYQPWNDRIVDLVNDRSDFVLLRVQPVYSSGPLTVVKCDVEMSSQLSSAD